MNLRFFNYIPLPTNIIDVYPLSYQRVFETAAASVMSSFHRFFVFSAYCPTWRTRKQRDLVPRTVHSLCGRRRRLYWVVRARIVLAFRAVVTVVYCLSTNSGAPETGQNRRRCTDYALYRARPWGVRTLLITSVTSLRILLLCVRGAVVVCSVSSAVEVRRPRGWPFLPEHRCTTRLYHDRARARLPGVFFFSSRVPLLLPPAPSSAYGR